MMNKGKSGRTGIGRTVDLNTNYWIIYQMCFKLKENICMNKISTYEIKHLYRIKPNLWNYKFLAFFLFFF